VATYSDGVNELTIQIFSQKDESCFFFETDAQGDSVYRRNGIDHIITENEGMTTVVWGVDSYQCAIFGNFSKHDAKMMIYSIYER